eukprot:137462-Rhodomonas_salina.3
MRRSLPPAPWRRSISAHANASYLRVPWYRISIHAVQTRVQSRCTTIQNSYARTTVAQSVAHTDVIEGPVLRVVLLVPHRVRVSVLASAPPYTSVPCTSICTTTPAAEYWLLYRITGLAVCAAKTTAMSVQFVPDTRLSAFDFAVQVDVCHIMYHTRRSLTWYVPEHSTPRNEIQETAFLVQIVLKLRFLV